MIKFKDSFIGKYLDNKVKLTDIDEFVKDWHYWDMPYELHEYLGMSEKEYSDWVKDPAVILEIIERHK